MSDERARVWHGPAPLLATAAILVAALLLLCGPATPAEARIQSLRVTNMTSPWGFEELYNTMAAPGNCVKGIRSLQKNCLSPCVSYAGNTDFRDKQCHVAAAPYCGAAPTGGDWCSMVVELEATMDLPGSTSSNNLMKMHISAPYFINVQKVSGPTYVAATTAIPENRARWQYQLSSAVQVSDPVIFAAAQGSNERSIAYNVFFSCNRMSSASLVFDPPKINCSDGTIRANATARGCPKFADFHSEMDEYLRVFDANTPITGYVNNLPTYTGPSPSDLNYENYREYRGGQAVFSYVNTTGPSKIEVVKRRAVETNTLFYPYPKFTWPPQYSGVRLGYRYDSGAASYPDDSYERWFLTPPAYYRDSDGDGFGVTLDSRTTFGTCDCNDNDATKTKTC